MTEENQKDLLSSQINIKNNAFGSPSTLVIIFNNSDECFHSIGWIHRPIYLEYVHNNIVPMYIAIFEQYFTSNDNINFYVTTKDNYIQKGKYPLKSKI